MIGFLPLYLRTTSATKSEAIALPPGESTRKITALTVLCEHTRSIISANLRALIPDSISQAPITYTTAISLDFFSDHTLSKATTSSTIQ